MLPLRHLYGCCRGAPHQVARRDQHITRRHPQVVIKYRCRVCDTDMPRGMKQLKAHVSTRHPEVIIDAHGMLVEAAAPLLLPTPSPDRQPNPALSSVTPRASVSDRPAPISRRVPSPMPSRAGHPGNRPYPALSPVVTDAGARVGRTVVPTPIRRMAPRAPSTARTPPSIPQRSPARIVPPAPPRHGSNNGHDETTAERRQPAVDLVRAHPSAELHHSGAQDGDPHRSRGSAPSAVSRRSPASLASTATAGRERTPRPPPTSSSPHTRTIATQTTPEIISPPSTVNSPARPPPVIIISSPTRNSPVPPPAVPPPPTLNSPTHPPPNPH